MSALRFAQIASVLFSVSMTPACAQVQDLGGAAPQGSEVGPGFDPTLPGAVAAPATTTPPRPRTLAACPIARPDDRTACTLAVAWCNYAHVDPSQPLATRCTCAADGRWACLEVRDPARKIEAIEVPFTNTSCSEGAPCAASARCAVTGQRNCYCASAGRFVCQPAPAE